jgi:cytochrome c553
VPSRVPCLRRLHTVHAASREPTRRCCRRAKSSTSMCFTVRIAQDATVQTARAEQLLLWLIPFFSQLQMTRDSPHRLKRSARHSDAGFCAKCRWNAHRPADRRDCARNPILGEARRLGNQTPPPYTAQAPGDPQRGADVYRTYCSSCHGATAAEEARPARSSMAPILL